LHIGTVRHKSQKPDLRSAWLRY